MDVSTLRSTSGSRFHLLSTDRERAKQWAASLPKQSLSSAVVRVLDGAKMKTIDGLLNEFALRLQFPAYFGHNFNALKDSLTDLAWLPGDCYVLLFTDGVSVLSGEAEDDFAALIRVLRVTADEWGRPVPQGSVGQRSAVPFHFVFQAAPDGADRLRERLERAGASPDI